jgi:uncharacterized membrane protein
MAVYTPLDYAIGLTILLVIMWLASKFLFTKLEFDIYFAIAMAPVIIFAIAVRVLADAGVYPKNELWSVTPGIYITATLFALALISVAKIIEGVKKVPYWKGSLIVGTPVAVYFLVLLLREMGNIFLMLEPIVLAVVLTAAIYILSNFSSATRLFREKENTAINCNNLWSHARWLSNVHWNRQIRFL